MTVTVKLAAERNKCSADRSKRADNRHIHIVVEYKACLIQFADVLADVCKVIRRCDNIVACFILFESV